jgi:hypothetical protein
MKFVMRTDPAIPHAKDDLLKIYSDIYVDLVAKNPQLQVHEAITAELFKTRMDEHIRSLPYFLDRKK